MRVGLAIETDRVGGAETMLLELAVELQSHGHDVFALGPSGREGWLTARFEDVGIGRDLVDLRGPFGLGTVPTIVEWIRGNRLDVLHSHEFRMAVCGALAARLAGCRHLITMHGGDYFASLPRRRAAFRVASALSSHTVAVSEAFRRTMAASVPMPISSIDVIHNGVAPLRKPVGDVRNELGVEHDDVMLLAVGSLYPVKGHSVLLEAVSRLRHISRRVVVAIAGSGQEEAKLRRLAMDLGIAEAVRFLGYRRDIPELLEASDVFVMPSLSEGLPMAMIEAMLAAKAIVGSDTGGIGELIVEPGIGVLVRPGDAEDLAACLEALIDDPERRDRLGQAARRRALEGFTASAMAEKYLRLYSAA